MIIRTYFDYNVYVEWANDESLIKDDFFEDHICYISVAHIEEFYKACMNDIKDINDDTKNIEDIISVFVKGNSWSTNEKIKELMISNIKKDILLKPSNTSIKAQKEKFVTCLDRIKKFDTRAAIEKNGKILYKKNKMEYQTLKEADDTAVNNTNLSIEEIWSRDELKNIVCEFKDYLSNYNHMIAKALADSGTYNMNQIYEVINKSKIDQSYELNNDCMGKDIPSFIMLECAIEFLNNKLNEIGYCGDKNERTTISGIHDTSHMIYATYCEEFYTIDKRLAKRAKAIYNYLGINTKVKLFEDGIIINT